MLSRGELPAREIATHVKVSLATVRRDLASLERRGLIERIWGGARVRSPVRYPSNYASQGEDVAKDKRAIASVAAARIAPDMVVGISGGTTCTELARWLRGKPVTVVTNALNVAMELYGPGRTRVIMTGGTLNERSFELVGDMATWVLHEHRLDMCFVGCSGITPDFGFSMRDRPEAAVARAFRAVSERTVVVADHRKVGRRTLARFAPLSRELSLVTDGGLDPEWQRTLRQHGLEVVLAPSDPASPEPGGST